MPLNAPVKSRQSISAVLSRSLRLLNGLWAHIWIRRGIQWVGGGLLALCLLVFPTTAYDQSHDLGSHATFEYLAAHHFQFGKEVYDNVGPYGYVHYSSTYSGYLNTRKILLANSCRLTLFILILWARRLLPNAGLRLWWFFSFFALILIGNKPLDLEQPLSYLPVYLGALYLLQDRDGWRYRLIWAGLLCVLAFLALTKHTSFVLISLVIACVSLQKLFSWLLTRQEPSAIPGAGSKAALDAFILLAGYIFFLLFHWAMAGQSLANFPSFLRAIAAFSSGYNDAMMLEGQPRIEILGFFMTATFLAGSIARSLARRQLPARLLIETLFIGLIWKHGFVRADSFHITGFLDAVFILATPWFFAHPPLAGPATPFAASFLRRRWAALGFSASMVTVVLALVWGCPQGLWHPDALANHLRYNAAWLLTPGRQTALLEEQLALSKKDASLPVIQARVKDASIDQFGCRPGLVLLNGLNYTPRPMPISFASCNPFLQGANESFYRDERTAPAYVLCNLQTIDGRAGFQDDALAFRALLDNYHPVLMEKEMLLFQRNPPPLLAHAEKQLLWEGTVQFRERIRFPNTNTGMLWIEANFEHSLWGSLRSFLYKPPACAIAWEPAGRPNDIARRRFVISMASLGCVISPPIEDNNDLARLYLPKQDLAGQERVESLAFGTASENCFLEPIRLRCYNVLAPPRSASNLPLFQ